jgi:hypothetical protein
MAYNTGSNRLSLFNKPVTNKSPGKYTKMFIKKYQKIVDGRKIRRKLFSIRNQNINLKFLTLDPTRTIGTSLIV